MLNINLIIFVLTVALTTQKNLNRGFDKNLQDLKESCVNKQTEFCQKEHLVLSDAFLRKEVARIKFKIEKAKNEAKKQEILRRRNRIRNERFRHMLREHFLDRHF
jgi:hypothetical protein